MKKRLISLLLALTLLIPCGLFTASATGVEETAPASGEILWTEDFESYADGAMLSTTDGFGTVTYLHEVREVEGNKSLRFPLIAADTTQPKVEPTTVGKYFQLPHTALPTDRLTSISARFYPHGIFGTQPTVGIWLQTYKYRTDTGAEASGKWAQLFNVDLCTGELVLPSNTVVVGSKALTPMEWNDVEVVFNPTNGSYLLYVNDALYARGALTTAKGYDFSVPSKHVLLVSNGNNPADGVTAEADVDSYDELNYLATDDWCIRTLTETADGAASTLPSYRQDFETLSLNAAPGFPSSVTTIQNAGTVQAESDGNRYWSVPFSGAESDKGAVNVNRNGYIDNPLLHYAHADMINISASYYIPAGSVGVVDARIGKAICTFIAADGTKTQNQQIVWLNLWRLSYLDGTGTLTLTPGGSNTGTAFVTEVDGWIDVCATVNLQNGSYTVAINGEIAIPDARMIPQYKATDWVHGAGLEDLVILPGELIPFSPHVTNPADADTWIGIDDLSIKPTDTVTLTVNGEERTVYEGSVIDLSPAGKKFLWATVTEKDGESHLTYEQRLGAKDGLSVEVRAVDFSAMDPVLRIDGHKGIRFLSKIDSEDLEALRADPFVKSVELGTTVVPSLYKGVCPDVLSPETLKGLKLLHFPVENDAFYTGIPLPGYSVFAASVTDIKEENHNLDFSGVGYLRITMNDEESTTRTLYTASGVDAKAVSYASLCNDAILSGLLSPALIEELLPIAQSYAPDMTETMQKDMEDLCVLALGDSTFFGDEYAWEYQWINWMAKDCGWALSNLAHGGESISYRETQNQTSIVDRLFNESEYKFGGTNSSSSPYRYTNEKALGRSADEVDIILITAGHNDFGGNTIYAPRGELTLENRDTTTYIGAWNVVLDELLVRYPNAKIVLVNQWYLPQTAVAQRGDELTRYEFTNSVAQMYHEFYWKNDRIHLLDAGDPRISNVHMTDPAFREAYSRNPSDVFHLNPDGMKIMKDAMLPYLWNLAVREQKAEIAE